MINHQLHKYKLVITIALKKEVPKEWFREIEIPVYSLAALNSGILKGNSGFLKGIIVVVTGPGLNQSENAACWICDNMEPHFVVNLGTCGLTDQFYPIGQWLQPCSVFNEDGENVQLDTRFPLPNNDNIVKIPSLLSVRNPEYGTLPSSWKKHRAIDQECYAQANIFQQRAINFYCLKMISDYSDGQTFYHFNESLELFVNSLKRLFSFVNNHIRPPEVSVIIPVYNRQHTIKRAIDSVLSQLYAPKELIVVDDGSTDKTPFIIKSYGDAVKGIYLSINRGVSRARNEGVKHALAEWIAFLDSDDIWKRDKLKKQLEYLKNYPFYEIMQSEEIWIRNGVRVNGRKYHKKPEGWVWEPSLHRCLISPSGVMIKKNLLERYGFFKEDFPVCEDYDLWLKITRHHPVGLEHSLSVIKYGGHSDQLSRSYPAMDNYRVKTLAHLLIEEDLPEFREKIIRVLSIKLQVLIAGAEKRKKFQQAHRYRETLRWASDFINFPSKVEAFDMFCRLPYSC